MESEQLENLVNNILSPDKEKSSSAINEFVARTTTAEIPNDLLIESESKPNEENLLAILSSLTPPQKIKLALTGNKFVRANLIRDSQRQVCLCVLKNNKVTEAEIFDFSKDINLKEDIFRNIFLNSSWMKHYIVKLNLVSNPKVPTDISMGLIKHLQLSDIRKLAASKNIPQLIATQCRKLIDKKKR